VPSSSGRLLVEVRDVTLADAPSRLVASRRIDAVRVAPGGLVAFELSAPSATPSASLGLRVQLEAGGAGAAPSQIYLTTVHWPVATEGDDELTEVRLQRV
jgi:putative lipoprotein